MPMFCLQLLQNVSRQFVEGDCSDALSQHNVSKNRRTNAVPCKLIVHNYLQLLFELHDNLYSFTM